MRKRLGIVALECLFDLGVTVLYATLAGLLIVAIVASDDGPITVLTAGVYAAILPAAACALIALEIATRALKEWHRRRAPSFRLDRARPELGLPRI